MPGRARAWSDTIISTVVVNSVIAIDLLANSIRLDTHTVIRTLIDVMVVPADGFEAVNSTMRVDLGIGVTSVEAFVNDDVPDPAQDGDYPPRGWVYAVTGTYYKGIAADDPSHFPRLVADIRSSRRVDKGRLFVKLNSTLVQNTQATTLWIGRIRALCLT